MNTPHRDEWVATYDSAFADSVGRWGEPRPISTEDMDRASAFLHEQKKCGVVLFWPGFSDPQWFSDHDAADGGDPEGRAMFWIDFNGWGGPGTIDRQARRLILLAIVKVRSWREGEKNRTWLDDPDSLANWDYERGWLEVTDEVRAELVAMVSGPDPAHASITINSAQRNELLAEVFEWNEGRDDWDKGFKQRSPDTLRNSAAELAMFARVLDSLGTDNEGDRDDSYVLEVDDLLAGWLAYVVDFYETETRIGSGVVRWTALKAILDLARGVTPVQRVA